MSIFNVLGTLLLLSTLNTSAKTPEKSIYIDNPNFLGVWEEDIYSDGKILKIQKVIIQNSKYNYVIKKKTNNPILKDKIYAIEYVAFIQWNSLKAINRRGKKKNFYILKTGVFTDFNQYYMVRKKT